MVADASCVCAELVFLVQKFVVHDVVEKLFVGEEDFADGNGVG